MTYLDTPFTFSYAFGLVDTREACIESSQEVFLRLLLDSPDTDDLKFDVLATLALRQDGAIDVEVLKDLIALIRPDRQGRVFLIDFVKSVDQVYKQARLLRASIRNSQKIDHAFEVVFNVVYVSRGEQEVASVVPLTLFCQPQVLRYHDIRCTSAAGI